MNFGQKVAFGPNYLWYFIKKLWGQYANPVEGKTWFSLFGL